MGPKYEFHPLTCKWNRWIEVEKSEFAKEVKTVRMKGAKVCGAAANEATHPTKLAVGIIGHPNIIFTQHHPKKNFTAQPPKHYFFTATTTQTIFSEPPPPKLFSRPPQPKHMDLHDRAIYLKQAHAQRCTESTFLEQQWLQHKIQRSDKVHQLPVSGSAPDSQTKHSIKITNWCFELPSEFWDLRHF